MRGQQVAQGHCKLFFNCEIGPSVKGPEKLGVGVGGGLESSLERCGGPWGELEVVLSHNLNNKLKCDSS